MNRKLSLSFFLLLGPLASCGSDSASTASLDNFIHASAEAECTWETRCCSQAEISNNFASYTTQDACVQHQSLTLQNQLVLARQAIQGGRMKFNQAAANACIAARQARQCNPKPSATPSTPQLSPPSDPCTQIFVGTTAVGHACFLQVNESMNSDECVAGAHCVANFFVHNNNLEVDLPMFDSLHGVCVPWQEVGQICLSNNDCDPTVPNIYCAPQDSKCHIYSKEGEPCAYTLAASGAPTTPILLSCLTEDSNGVATGLYCDPSSNTCKQLPKDGESCLGQPLRSLVKSPCAPGSVCANSEGMSGTCRAVHQVGEPCDPMFSQCGDNLFCDTQTVPNKPVCAMLPGAGSPCQGGKGGNCNSSAAYCDSTGQCQKLSGLNEDCSKVACDTGLYCGDEVGMAALCQAQLADYQPCQNNDQCLSNNCEPDQYRINHCLPQVICTGR